MPRPGPRRQYVGARMSPDQIEAIDKEAERQNVDRSEIIRRAVDAYVKTGAAVLLAVAAILTLGACGAADDATLPVAERTAVAAPSVPVETSEAVAAVSGEDVETGEGTMKIAPLDTGWYSVEVYTDELVVFDGTYTGTDSAGVEHVGTSMLDVTRANGYAGNQVRFDATDIVTITYDDGPVSITWTVG